MDKETNEFMLLFSGPEWDEGVTNEEVEKRMAQVMAWFDGLQATGKVKGGQPLARKRSVVSRKPGALTADGPFAESKEAIGGYLVLEADSFEEAREVAESCPTLDYGISIEVRPILQECPVFKRVKERLALAVV